MKSVGSHKTSSSASSRAAVFRAIPARTQASPRPQRPAPSQGALSRKPALPQSASLRKHAPSQRPAPLRKHPQLQAASRPQQRSEARQPFLTQKPRQSQKSQPAKSRSTDYEVEKQRQEHKISSWQNPVITYFTNKYPRFRFKHQPQSRHKRLERQIMSMLAFFSISIGLWENFRQLWLQDNGFSATDVSNVIGFATIISAAGALWLSKYVKMSQLKRFMAWTLVGRCFVFAALACLNHTELRFLIDIFSALEIFTSSIFLTCVYPLITIVNKNNDIFSRRKLVEYLFRDLGILIGGIFVGQELGNFLFDYNACLLFALAFLVVATIIMWRLNIVVAESAPEERSSIVRTVRAISRDRIQRIYMFYIFLTEAAFATAMGLKMLMLTDSFGFSPGIATNYLLVAGLISDFVGILALRYFTPKNDYVTITLKFGLRFVAYSLAAISGSSFLCFLAFTWAILSSTAYENITDGYYVNAIDNRYQFKYNTVRHVTQYCGVAFGTFLCGQMFGLGPAAVFGLAAFMVVLQLFPAYYLVYLRQQRGKPVDKKQ